MKPQSRVFIFGLIVVGAAMLAIGILIGQFGIPDGSCSASSSPSTNTPSENETISVLMIEECQAENIEEHVRQLSSRPHLAGTPAEKENAEMLVSLWTEYGLDSVRLLPYDVLLAYPDPDNPNKVMITDNGVAVFTSALTEAVLRPEDNNTDVVPPFNAYSAQGEPEGPLVYVNYGTADDFDWLAKNRPDININGSIVIVKYGNNFRGQKVLHAQLAGAIGVIMYSDPNDYARDGSEAVYQNDWWLPDTGVQRGTVKVGSPGDPITPGYPAKPYMYRLNASDPSLPTIPVHPISYGDAQQLLSELGGDEVQNAWKGGLNITYRYGPGFTDPNRKVKMSIQTSREIRTIYNVIGVINGAVEPDRYVLLGNHRDAWVYGAVDPSSGTGILMETTRVYSQMLKIGWRPRRSVMFCSWGAEEYGLVGSTEFVEEYQKILGERAVAYINIDSAVVGNFTFGARATPLLQQAVWDAAKKVPDGETQERSAYDVWLERVPDPRTGTPFTAGIGSGSDYAPFMHRIGVPSTDLLYVYDFIRLGLSSYPVYHSVYETFYYVKNFLDRNFWRHLTVARVYLELSRDLADSVILPFGCADYAAKLQQAAQGLERNFGVKLTQNGVVLDDMKSALDNFTESAQNFEMEVSDIDLNDAYAVRRVNDQMMQLERAFIDPAGLPDRQWLRHVIFAPSSVDTYSGAEFPAVVDALYLIDDDPDQETRWNNVRKQLAILTFTIQSAASTLNDVTQL
ncbi:glutamate carboxypeptidase 2 [Strongylocentrotus purpuratus]|uniref:glutamate carboxypeptidase II n=1 Tax=Strongylocentrotus purpuratus TaxID=7668 RepID=A0A7M7PPL3_STRPU|nr:glutamate carboxypeptidase 2 [Strongylocentrotus purpuratus]